MPVIKSAKKKLRADLRRKIVNLKVKGKMKAALKSFTEKPTPTTLSAAYAALDLAAKKRAIPKNRADRKKSRLATALSRRSKTKQLSTKKTTKTATLRKPSKKL
ncbi:MAG: hypothetical protein A2Z11_03680 [Candidatus Woykebacteria bacterium RBG_16_43_9]|uniref:Small ribosomal subunit protein bS20 n=1 Tax=Candidatus Woykebacteria bacterium RBG_16_43_9 TaxID=1802596 RepID=A0A1G1WDE4_9BACT|nr:MAG: hypothetical protein A2Z11_03680 [Candidatus Woykebacteria bacterium RBG_16_43_9]